MAKRQMGGMQDVFVRLQAKNIAGVERAIREIEKAFAEKVFATALSKSIRIEEAIAQKKGVIHHKHLGSSRAREEVILIGNELLARLGVDADLNRKVREAQRWLRSWVSQNTVQPTQTDQLPR